MRRFKSLALTAVLLGTFAPFFLMAGEADAATARARCRIVGGRIRIQVDGQDLEPGRYAALLTNRATRVQASTTPGKEKTATTLSPDVDLDFDSTAGAGDLDSFIAPTFARVTNSVKADVLLLVANQPPVTVASATAVCTR